MKVLVVGYGSIGERHVRNLSNNASAKEIKVYTKIIDSIKNAGEHKVTFIDASINDLASVTDQYKFDFAIIANETYKHIDTAIILAQKGIHLFIEKPLSHNLKKVDRLKAITQKNNIQVFVAYNLRYLPAIQYLKDQLSQRVLGDLYFAHIEVGQYLPSWRTNINYTESYSAYARCGGGVSLDLSHEVDYMRYLFGEPALWKTIKSKASKLKIDSEDLFEGIYKFRKGFVCHVHMDYLQSKAKRKIRIVGKNGEIQCDLVEKWINVQTGNHEISLKEEDLFNTEDTYKTELQHFITTLASKKASAITIDDGIKDIALLEDSYD